MPLGVRRWRLPEAGLSGVGADSAYHDALMLGDGSPTGEKSGDSSRLPYRTWALDD